MPVLPSRDRKGAVAACLAIFLAGCGYIGDTLPPALRRPVRVYDLAAVQRGSNIIIQFTIPKVTTEDLPIKGGPDVELRVGPQNDPSDAAAWQRTAEREPVDGSKSSALVIVAASKWYNKTVAIAVNAHGPAGHSVGWSPFVYIPVVPALPKPEAVVTTDAPDAVHLEWHAGAPEFRVFRKLPEDSNWTQIGTSNKPSYTDGMIEYGKSYQYLVQSIQKIGDIYAESELSEPQNFKPKDNFPPAVPSGLSPVPGTRSIELVWDRNTEKDFASYRVYRDDLRIAAGVTSTTFSDRDVKPGVKYRYQISALDTAGNESAKSPAVEAALP
jgi:hypothetical protein